VSRFVEVLRPIVVRNPAPVLKRVVALAVQERAPLPLALRKHTWRRHPPYDRPGRLRPALEQLMTLEEYNEAVKQIITEQQGIGQMTAQLAMTGQANPTNPQFGQIMTKQWALMQQMAKLNTDLMMGIMSPKK
jgi:hypothetical protein